MDIQITKNWENLYVPEPVLKAIVREKFVNPTEIQKLTLPSAIRDRLDILGAAATGTGKTLAFGIPMIARILMDKQKEIEIYEAEIENKDCESEDQDDVEMGSENEECDLSPSESELENQWKDEDVKPTMFIGAENIRINPDKALPYQHIYGLVLTPTRELACQVADHLKKACRFTDLKVCSIFGGMSVDRQERLLNKRPEILVVTPGRFWSFIQDQEPHALSASRLSVLVIDEADRMLEKGHFSELENLMVWLKTNSGERVTKAGPIKDRQTFVFSATLTFVHSADNTNVSLKRKPKVKLTSDNKLNSFISKLGMRKNPKIIDTAIDVAQLRQWRILCPEQFDKDVRLFWFLRRHRGRTLVFANSKNSVRRLSSVLKTLGLTANSLMADMQQKMRLKKLESFTRQSQGLLIASDVAARGLDIPNVDYVIHFDVAHTAETHLHRSGRTARASNPGHSVIMMCPGEVTQFNKLLFSLHKTSNDVCEIPIDRIDEYEEVVRLAREIESQGHQSKSATSSRHWFEKMAERADIALDDDIKELRRELPVKNTVIAHTKKIQQLQGLIADLDQLDAGYVSPIVEVATKHNSNLATDDHIATVVQFQSETKPDAELTKSDKNTAKHRNRKDRKRKLKEQEQSAQPEPKTAKHSVSKKKHAKRTQD